MVHFCFFAIICKRSYENMIKLKNKKIIIGSTILLVSVIILIFFMVVKSNQKLLILKNDIVIVEYGQPISTDPRDYLDLNKLDNKKRIDVLNNISFKSNISNEIETVTNPDGTIHEKDKGYAAVGDYLITLRYKNESKTIKVKVEDTVAPELTVPERVEIVQGTNLETYDFKSLISAQDLALVNDFTFDTSLVNVEIPGEYIAKVSVEDASKNKTEKEFKVVIITSPAKDEGVVQEIITNEDNTKDIKGITKKKGNQQSSSNITNNSNSSNNFSSPKPDTSDSNSDKSSSNSTKPNTGSSEGNSNSDSIISNKYIKVTWSYQLGDRTMNESWVGSEDKWSENLVYLPQDAYNYTGISKQYITYEEYKRIMGY